MTIDVGRLERDVAAADGDLVALNKEFWAEIIADLRSGHAARLIVARGIAFDDVCSAIRNGEQP